MRTWRTCFSCGPKARQQELAVRAALGANRGRIARELLSESVGLALAGGAARACCSPGRHPSARKAGASWLARIDEIGIESVVLVFTVAISVVTGLCSASYPS